MLWASCKDYADSTSNESDIFKYTESGMVFWFGGILFFLGKSHVLLMWLEYLMKEMSK
jgi:hypothetical protein